MGMAFRLEEGIHGIELRPGTKIGMDLVPEFGDSCIGYFKEINEKGITICPSQRYCFSSDSNCDFVIPLDKLAQVYWIGNIIIQDVQIKRYVDITQN